MLVDDSTFGDDRWSHNPSLVDYSLNPIAFFVIFIPNIQFTLIIIVKIPDKIGIVECENILKVNGKVFVVKFYFGIVLFYYATTIVKNSMSS